MAKFSIGLCAVLCFANAFLLGDVFAQDLRRRYRRRASSSRSSQASALVR